MIKVDDRKKRLILTLINYAIKFLYKLSHPFASHPKPVSCVNKILLIRLDHIGDVAMASALPRLIKEGYPGAKITMMVGSWAMDLLKYNPYLDEILCHDVPWWASVRQGMKTDTLLRYIADKYLPLLKKIKKEKFDVAIDLRGDIRQIILFMLFPKIRQRLGYDRSGGEYLLTHPVIYDKTLHETQKNLRILDIINISSGSLKPEIYIPEDKKSQINEIFEANGVKEHDIKIMLSPGARVKVKRWPLDNFIRLGALLEKKYGAWIIFTGTSKEIDKKDIPSSQKFINLIDELDLLQLTALFEKIHLLISNDSGVTHIASSRDVPMVVLFGPTDPSIYKPIADKLSIITKKFPCSPCLHKTCKVYKTGYGKCMSNIAIEEVMSEVEKIL
jgi:lipopolysaccharide heptosyltransferase II